MQSSRGQIKAEDLRRQDRSFVEEYAERYDLSKSLPTEEIISRIFIKSRKTIPILQKHIWEGDEERVELTGRIEMPEQEEFLAHDRPQEPSSSRLLPDAFPPPPKDTYSPSPPRTPVPSGRGRSSPHRDAKEPENWLQEMLVDFERGRNDLTSDLEELVRTVKETSYQVLNLCTEIKSERRDIKIFLDAIEKVCGNEILNQIKADARATVLASRESPDTQNQTDNDLAQGQVIAPVDQRKKEIPKTAPLPASTTGTKKVRSSGSRTVTKRSFEEIDEGSTSSSATSSNRNKRTRHEARDDHDGSGSDDSDNICDQPHALRAHLLKRLGPPERKIPRSNSISSLQATSGSDYGEEWPSCLFSDPSTFINLIPPQANDATGESSSSCVTGGNGHNAPGHIAPGGNGHTAPGGNGHTAPEGNGHSAHSAPGSPTAGSTTAAAPRLGRPLTRQYNVWFSLEDPPVPSSTSPVAGTNTSTTLPQAASGNQAESSTHSAAGRPFASTLFAATGGSSPSSTHSAAGGRPVASTLFAATDGSSPSSPPSAVPPPSQSQIFRSANWNPPVPAPSHLRRRPLRREYERIAVDPITNRVVSYDHSGAPDFGIARAAQAAEDVATIRRLAEEMDPVIVADGELDFMDEEEEEVILGEHDDLPI